jgi:hypothetical protein
MRLGLFPAILMALWALGANNQALSQGIPNAQPCVGRALNGNSMPAMQMVGPSNFWAQTSWPGGIPTITYSQPYFQLPPLMQKFTSLHECGHASTQNLNEFAANCYALQKGHFTKAEVAQIAAFHQGVGPIGPQYGGSGAAFWAGTVAMCPQLASAGGPVPPGPKNPPAPGTNCGLPPGYSLVCRFTSGPRAGQIINFCGLPANPAPVGGPCTDGAGSFGVAQ